MGATLSDRRGMRAVATDKRYPRAYVDACETRVEEEIEAFRALTAGSPPEAVERFEPVCFGNLVVILNAMFIHRVGAPADPVADVLEEVRLLADSLLGNDGVMSVPDGSGYDPASSVLGIADGERIAIRAGGFDRLSSAYFAAIEAGSVEE